MSATSDASSTSIGPGRPVRSSDTPPNNGTEPPQTPLRPAAGVTGTPAAEQSASTAETCSAEVGRTTTEGQGGDLAPVGPGDGHRPPVAPGLDPVRLAAAHLGPALGDPPDDVGRDGDPGAAQALAHRRRGPPAPR